MTKGAAVILAGGRGTRMKSRRPKVLHLVAGKPILQYVVAAARHDAPAQLLVVVPPDAEAIRAAVEGPVTWVEQSHSRGTADGVSRALPHLDSSQGYLVVMSGDAPLVKGETVTALRQLHQGSGARITLLTSRLCPPQGLGRILRDESGRVKGIVEEVEGGEEGEEVNAGAYVFDLAWLREHLPLLQPRPNGELYLTDLVGVAYQEQAGIEPLESRDKWDAMGINTRVHLAQAERAMRDRICQRWMLAGVTILDPASTFIDADVELGQDTIVYPHTELRGRSRIGEECHVGAQTVVVDSVVGDRCRIQASTLEGAYLEEDVSVGPYSHLRPGTYLEREVHLGNYVEVKKSRLGRGTRAGHFSYVGDATVGPGVNIGAGTVTCNYDGVRKNPTVIEEGAFIGSGCMLVAPVRVGARAVTGAGSVVTRDVPPDTVVVGVPARVLRAKAARLP